MSLEKPVPACPPLAVWLGPAPLFPRVISILRRRRIFFFLPRISKALFSSLFWDTDGDSSTCCNTFWSRSQKCEPIVVLNLNFKKLMRMSSHRQGKIANPPWVTKVPLKVMVWG